MSTNSSSQVSSLNDSDRNCVPLDTAAAYHWTKNVLFVEVNALGVSIRPCHIRRVERSSANLNKIRIVTSTRLQTDEMQAESESDLLVPNQRVKNP
jgi:hypothetical protein